MRGVALQQLASLSPHGRLLGRRCHLSEERASALPKAHKGTHIRADLASHGKPTSAYIHLPFCKRRCFYCDFPIQTIGDDLKKPGVRDKIESYIDVLRQEISCSKVGSGAELQTIYFGGGTPSLIPPSQLELVLSALRDTFGIAAGAEISMEADPGTFDKGKLMEYTSLGINRFSIGVQAFQEEALAECGRSHSLVDVYKAIEAVHAAGVKNWSLDLISGLPNMTVNDWHVSLREAVAASPTHISVYDLQVEEGTKFGRLFSPGQSPLPTDDSAAEMYCSASEVLRAAGMEHYEVSSYARPGYRCHHNMVYWSGKPYLAFGLGSASYTNWQRFSRPKSMAAYRSWVQQLTNTSSDQVEGSKVDHDEILLDRIMLSLRQSDGLDLESVRHQFGQQSADTIRTALTPHLQSGLVQEKGSCVVLTTEGFLLSNSIIADVFARL